MFAFDVMCSAIGKSLARYLTRPSARYRAPSTVDPEQLRAALQPGDVLLVEGNTKLSTAIKYLTQSTWSHAALYIGEIPGIAGDGAEPNVLIEADVVEGVRAIQLSLYSGMHTRICRPVGLTGAERRQVIDFVIASIGNKYDLKNVIDLARYLLPTPPVPTRWRRAMLYLGSGEPTRAICSTLIAQAFQSVRYPILPIRDTQTEEPEGYEAPKGPIFRKRHYSLFAPRDFDISPYFKVIKPSLDDKFDFHRLRWAETAQKQSSADGRRPVVSGS